MKINIDTELEIGQMLYYIQCNSKTVYKPCPICENKRRVDIEIKGNNFNTECPRCTGRQTKGDESSSIVIRKYSIEYEIIKQIAINQGNKISVITNRYGEIELETLCKHRDQYYTDEAQAKAVARELNAIEKAKEKQFLDELKGCKE